MTRIITRLVADAALVALLLLAAAGTLAWQSAWVLLAVMLLVRIVGAVAVYRVNPTLLTDRAKLPVHADQPWSDRLLLVIVLSAGMLGIPTVAARDVFYWHVFPLPAPTFRIFGLALFASGWILKSIALRANAFAVPVVRAQHEQVLADSGVYGVIRHPFYAADPLILTGIGLWLGSYVAVLAASIPVAAMMARAVMEERFLQRELPGYSAYMARVRYRLVPGIW